MWSSGSPAQICGFNLILVAPPPKEKNNHFDCLAVPKPIKSRRTLRLCKVWANLLILWRFSKPKSTPCVFFGWETYLCTYELMTLWTTKPHLLSGLTMVTPIISLTSTSSVVFLLEADMVLSAAWSQEMGGIPRGDPKVGWISRENLPRAGCPKGISGISIDSGVPAVLLQTWIPPFWKGRCWNPIAALGTCFFSKYQGPVLGVSNFQRSCPPAKNNVPNDRPYQRRMIG